MYKLEASGVKRDKAFEIVSKFAKVPFITRMSANRKMNSKNLELLSNAIN